MTTYTSQPDATDGIDTFIDDSATSTNYGTETRIAVGEWNSGSSVCRGLLKFDFTKGTNPPPSNVTVLSATLYLYAVQDLTNNVRTIRAYRVLRNWVEGQATWNVYSTGNNWGTAGCSNTTTDRLATDMGNTSVANPPTDITISLDTATVLGWINGTINNYGMLLKVDTETDDQTGWGSSDNATAGLRPKLVVEYFSGGGFFKFSS